MQKCEWLVEQFGYISLFPREHNVYSSSKLEDRVLG